jgi:hypothetical protein
MTRVKRDDAEIQNQGFRIRRMAEVSSIQVADHLDDRVKKELYKA